MSLVRYGHMARMLMPSRLGCHTINACYSHVTRMIMPSRLGCHTINACYSHVTRMIMPSRLGCHTINACYGHVTRMIMPSRLGCHTINTCYRSTATGPHLTKLPEGLLQTISRQLADCDSACSTSSLDGDMLDYAEALVKCLIVTSRY